MTARFNLHYNEQKCVELSQPNGTVLVYRIPYGLIKNHGLSILNRFIVYILFAKNTEGKDYIYVGKSKNGLDNRPTAHNDKCSNWEYCYVLTNFKERTYFNDGIIQYLEDQVNKRVNETKRFTNTTINTNKDAANSSDISTCDEFLTIAYDMLNFLGLDLITLPKPSIEDIRLPSEPDYNMSPNVKELYSKVKSSALDVNKDIKLNFTKYYINFTLDDSILFSVEPFKSFLKIFLTPKKSQLTPNDLLEDVSGKGHHSSGKTLLVLEDDTKLELLKDYINQIINL